MPLAAGREYLAIPGPSVIPDRVLRAMHRPAPNIYAGGLVEMVDTILPDLKAVARTEGEVAIYIANGHGVWEAALANVLSRGDKVLALATGHFAHSWAAMARQLGAIVEVMDFGRHAPIDPDVVAERLRAAGTALAHGRDHVHLPPMDTLYVQRKVGGMFLLASRLRARVPLRGLVDEALAARP